MTTGRVFVVVRGGIVEKVHVPAWVDGSFTVIDFDDAENDANGVWERLDDVDQAWVRRELQELFELYFGTIDARRTA